MEGVRTEPRDVGALSAALARLDSVLMHAVDEARELYGAAAATDRFRGLYITDADAAALLARTPGAPLFGNRGVLESASRSLGADPRADTPVEAAGSATLDWLRDAFGLSRFELDVLLLAVAPEIDQRYERVYAYLQDDVSRRRPSVDLALHLFCASADARVVGRTRLAVDAPLLRQRLIELVWDPLESTCRHASLSIL